MLVITREIVKVRCFSLSKPFGASRRHSSAWVLMIALLAGLSVHPAKAARHRPTLALAAAKQIMVRSAHHANIMHKPSPALPIHRAEANYVNHTAQIAPAIVDALRTAKQEVSADPFVLLAIAWKESRFDPLARNKHSSARGLLQFTTVTWLTVIRDFGARHGLAHLAAAIRTDREGRLSVTTPRLHRAILGLRDDPNLEVTMAAERLTQQRGSLEACLGRPATSADLYVLHLLGPAGAKDFLTQLAEKPDSSSVDTVRDVAKPNLGLFVRDGRALSVAEAYAGIQITLNEQTTLYAALFDKQDL
jgi:hypothetical protein